jgi:hypothetical protein
VEGGGVNRQAIEPTTVPPPPAAPETVRFAAGGLCPVTVLGVLMLLNGVGRVVDAGARLMGIYLATRAAGGAGALTYATVNAPGDIVAVVFAPLLGILCIIAGMLLLRRRPAGRVLAQVGAALGPVGVLVWYAPILWLRAPAFSATTSLHLHAQFAGAFFTSLAFAVAWVYFLSRASVREACSRTMVRDTDPWLAELAGGQSPNGAPHGD